ncbi:hypothetical protein [Streptomyces swartbergensis]|uniref:Uncharacterized protein n=1 Tax=Streptomyces swartbergensis TaxID=487165 RepID=A0A243S6V9_9ACTN|nr:hypothetical protein [Streptomyces swartbergensis]OUD03355.1 hypothetical protein CA983_10115 [Streptomyces swartbergensis]
MVTTLPETTLLVWYCRRCDKSCKVQPPDPEQIGCRCENPVPGLRPTQVTIMHAPKPRPMHALSDEEARLLALARKGTKVRVTFEGEIADAWQWSNGISRGLGFVVKSPDGRTHTVNVQQPGLHIEAITDEESAS